MKLIYIPFNFDDAVLDLHPKATRWLRNETFGGMFEQFVILHDSNWIEKKPEIVSALKKGQCSIYILSHGIPTERHVVANQSEEDDYYQEITIATVAKRFLKTFIDPIEGEEGPDDTFSPLNTVKLFFCDEYTKKDKAREMAKSFRKIV